MSEDIQELVKLSQAGEDVRGEIEQKLFDEEIEEKLIKNNSYLDGYDEYNTIFNKSLDYSLNNYDKNKGMKFTSYFYKVYLSRLINEYKRQKVIHEKEEAIKNKAAYLEATELFRENYSDDELFNDFIYITKNEFLEMSDPEYNYMKTTIELINNNYYWDSDEAAADALGVNADTIRRYKKNLKGLLIENYRKLKDEKNKRYEAAKIADDLERKPFNELTQEEQEILKKYGDKPLSIFNEYNIADPTPLAAIRNIERNKS